MNEFSIICSNEEAHAVLCMALDMKVFLMIDWPYENPAKRLMISPEEALSSGCNVIFLVKDEWIIGPLVFNKIDKGDRSGSFSLQPRVNFAGIEFFSSGERLASNIRRLSIANIALRSRPIDSSTYCQMEEIEECKEFYHDMVANIMANFHPISVGGREFMISDRSEWAIRSRRAFPPFPYQDSFFFGPDS